MSFLDVNLSRDTTPDLTEAPAGEYTLECIKNPESKKGKDSGKPYLALIHKIVGGGPEPDANFNAFGLVFDNISLPNEDDDDSTRSFKIRKLRDCVEAFGVEHDDDGFDLSAFEGNQADAILAVEPDNNDVLRNIVSRWIGGA